MSQVLKDKKIFEDLDDIIDIGKIAKLESFKVLNQ